MKRTKAGIFRKDSYNSNNDWAIDKVINYLEKKGYMVEYKDQEDFDIDIICYKNTLKYKVEVEVKNTYFFDEESYPFDTVSFLKRKQKYSKNSPFYYFLLCAKNDSFLYCDSDTIYQTKYYVKTDINTSQRYGKDELYRVPKHLCKFRKFKK